MIKSWLTHPLSRDLDIDDPHTSELRRQIIQKKRFLKKTYEEWYSTIAASLRLTEGAVLELGSGGGFMSEFIFERDREKFGEEFKELQIVSVRPIMPFRYVVSGGVYSRSLMPGLTYSFWCLIEHALHPWINQMAMFAEIILQRR